MKATDEETRKFMNTLPGLIKKGKSSREIIEIGRLLGIKERAVKWNLLLIKRPFLATLSIGTILFTVMSTIFIINDMTSAESLIEYIRTIEEGWLIPALLLSCYGMTALHVAVINYRARKATVKIK